MTASAKAMIQVSDKHTPYITTWFKSHLFINAQSIQFKNLLMSPISCHNQCSTGSVLAPLLFFFVLVKFSESLILEFCCYVGDIQTYLSTKPSPFLNAHKISRFCSPATLSNLKGYCVLFQALY